MSRKKTYPPRFPRFAGGIKLQLKDSGVRSWWVRKWLDRIVALSAGTRAGKARQYALRGQVAKLEMAGSHVTAQVVGARPGAYRVELDFRQVTGAARARILAGLRKEPVTIARLLAGELPMEVEELFRKEGFDLFPGTKLGLGQYDMTCSCTCPDWANPCKHVLALLYILGGEIAVRPLILLELRGLKEEELYAE